ncbi:MAG: hypothetical protein WBD20_12745 [Pirellulaceae bacterium]
MANYQSSPLEMTPQLPPATIDEHVGDETFSEAFAKEFGESGLDEYAADDSARLSLIPAGFMRSRWAMSDPQYATKYANGASKLNLPKKIKQAADARFVDDFAGWYISAGLTSIGDTPSPLGSIELGFTGYQTSYLTNRVGFVAALNDEDFYIGGETGIRLQTPTRLAPFVGLGLFAGASSTRSPAEHDDVDNDDDGSVDEDGETEFDFDGALAAVYPEAGLHFWWTPRVRFSGFGRYMITTEGRRADSTYFGASVAILSR